MTTWRIAFVAGAVLMFVGGPMHPDGTMEEMLADPRWLSGHLLMFGSFVAMLIGLHAYGRTPPAQSMRRTMRFVIIATAAQAFEMFVHAIAYVDLERLRAMQATPVLTTHLAMTAVVYPVFAVAVIAFIIGAAKQRQLGSWWIAWIGIAGVAAHGIAGFFTVVFAAEWAPILFPGIVLLAVWLLLAGIWPAKPAERAAAAAT